MVAVVRIAVGLLYVAAKREEVDHFVGQELRGRWVVGERLAGCFSN